MRRPSERLDSPTMQPLRFNRWDIPDDVVPSPRSNVNGGSSDNGRYQKYNAQAYSHAEFGPRRELHSSPDTRYASTNLSSLSTLTSSNNHSHPNGTPQHLNAHRPRIEGGDPNKPSVAGYSQPQHYTEETDVEPELSKSPERRVMTPKALPDSPGPETPDKEGLLGRLPLGPAGSRREEQYTESHGRFSSHITLPRLVPFQAYSQEVPAYLFPIIKESTVLRLVHLFQLLKLQEDRRHHRRRRFWICRVALVLRQDMQQLELPALPLLQASKHIA